MVTRRSQTQSRPSLLRALSRVLLAAGALLLASSAALAGMLLVWSYPGRPKPFLDPSGQPLAGSIAEKVFVDINGVEQGMFIKGKDVTNPVLLYLHGGMPDYFLTRRYPTGLDEDFTVVWWEQRGAGLSYDPAATEQPTAEVLIADTLAVTDYLRERFGQEKIYLMGHSGGTFFGIQAAARAPERYHAYIAVAQMANQRASEKQAYDYMLEQFTAQGDQAMVRRLEQTPVTLEGGTPPAYLAVRDTAMHRLGVGTMHSMTSILDGLVLESFRNPDYTLREKIRFWRAKATAGVSVLWQEVMSTDLKQTVPALSIPVYFLHGIYDYTCSYAEAKAYFDALDAPLKGFYTFAHSAHSPMFEEPARVRTILQEDVLAGTNRLADAD